MRLLIKKRYCVIILIVVIAYIGLNCLFIGKAIGEDDISMSDSLQPESTPDVTTEPMPEKQGISQEEPQPIEAITRIFELKNVDIMEAKERLQPLLSKDKDVASSIDIFTVEKNDKEFNYLIVKDRQQNIEQVSLMIEQLEKEFAPVLVNVDFTDVELSKVLTAIARTTDLNIIGGDELSQKVSTHLKDVPLDDVFDILLKFSGYTYSKEGKVLNIIPEVKVPLVTDVFELQNVSAPKVEEAVTHLISQRGTLKSFSKFQENKYSHFLVITDTKEVVERVRQIVNKLDKKIRQVMIEAKFAEVTLDKDDELGIDWVMKASITGSKVSTMFPFSKGDQSAEYGVINRPDSMSTTTGSFTLGTISYSDFSATFRALDTKSVVSLIASPSVATRDGEEAEIIIGDKVPIPLYERNEETGSLEITGYQEQEVGVLLRVTPIINNDDTVTLTVHPEVSEITGYTGPSNERPIVSTREVTTIFTVENGKTIVLGGLTKKTTSNTVHKIPFLSDIPIVGKIFTYNDDSDDRKELLIFITPRILDKSETVLEEQAQEDIGDSG